LPGSTHRRWTQSHWLVSSTCAWNPRSFTSSPGDLVSPPTMNRQLPEVFSSPISAPTPVRLVRVGSYVT